MIHVHMPENVLDDARTRQRDGEPELTADQAEEIVAPLRKGIRDLPPEEYAKRLRERLREFVAAQDMELESPDTRSAFWSYRLEDHPSLDLQDGESLKSMHVAAAYTEAQNAITEDTLRYLEGTPGGKALGEFCLWNPEVHEALELDETTGYAVAADAWSALSDRYAATTENDALFFMAELNPGTVAYQTESRRLRQQGKLDLMRFMYPAPMGKYADLAPETQELLATDGVRAQVHTFGYDENDPKHTPLTKAGHLDLEHLKSLPTPEAQRAAVLEACARVAAMDGPARAADLESLVEEIKVLRPDQDVSLPAAEDLAWAAEVRSLAPGESLDQKRSAAQEQTQEQTQEQAQEQTQEQTQEQSPAVSTHGTFLPGVQVDAKLGPTPIQPLAPAPQAAAGAQFLPGVTPKPVPKAAPAPVTPASEQAPPAPERSHGTGMGE